MIVRRLAETADVIIESFAPGVARKLGVDHDTLVAGREDVICCSISGFGQRGPKSREPGYDAILQAFSGMLALNGEAGTEPVRLPASPIDQVTGLYATQGILAALLQRQVTGKGCRIEVSLLESAIRLLAPNLQAYWASGELPTRSGSGHPSVVPYQLYDTADRPILLAIANEKFWRAFCDVAGLTDTSGDPRFATNVQRVRNREATNALVAQAMRARKSGEWMDLLGRAGIPASPLNTIADISKDPHMAELGMFRLISLPNGEVMRAVCEPILFDGERADPERSPPMLGEHGREILARELGYGEAEIDRLISTGAIVEYRALANREEAA